MKTALLTGVTGQDGSYLTRFLLGKGYQVHGIIRRSSTFNTDRIDDIYQDPHDPGARLLLHYGDLTDGTSLRHWIERAAPDEIYNLGAQSHVKSRSSSRNTRPTPSRWARCVCSKPCGTTPTEPGNPCGSIKPVRRRCLARLRRLRMKRLRFTPAAPTA